MAALSWEWSEREAESYLRAKKIMLALSVRLPAPAWPRCRGSGARERPSHICAPKRLCSLSLSDTQRRHGRAAVGVERERGRVIFARQKIMLALSVRLPAPAWPRCRGSGARERPSHICAPKDYARSLCPTPSAGMAALSWEWSERETESLWAGIRAHQTQIFSGQPPLRPSTGSGSKDHVNFQALFRMEGQPGPHQRYPVMGKEGRSERNFGYTKTR